MVAARHSDGAALVGGDDVAPFRRIVENASAKILQERIGHSAEKIQPFSDEGIVELFRVYHVYSLGMRVRTSLMGRHNSSASLLRPCSRMHSDTSFMARYAARSRWFAWMTIFAPASESSSSVN